MVEMTKPEFDVHSSTVFADHVEPVLERTTRYNYLKGYVPLRREIIRRRIYVYSLSAIGLLALFYYPVVSAVAFFGAAYHYQRVRQWVGRLTSKRHVMWGH